MEQQACCSIDRIGHRNNNYHTFKGIYPRASQLDQRAGKAGTARQYARSWLFSKSKIGKQYGGFRKFINEKEAYKAGGYPIPRRFRKKNGIIVQADSSFYSFKKFTAGVRAAFYVNWDPKSFSSLEQNIARLNMVIPEWLFINPNADTLETNIDTKALDIMNKAGVKVLPLLTNNYKEVFRGDVVHRISE